MMNLQALGGRRFLLTVISGAGTFLLTWLKIIDGNIYATVTIATVAAYITGNVVESRRERNNPGDSGDAR
jgi:hypothetical protein